MTLIEDLQPGQLVTLPSGFTGAVASVADPLTESTWREVVVVDQETGQPALYFGRLGETL